MTNALYLLARRSEPGKQHAHSRSLLVLLRSSSDTVRKPAAATGPALNAAPSRPHYTKGV